MFRASLKFIETHYGFVCKGIWEFHTEDRGGRGRLHRHIKKEEEKGITISLIVFEQHVRPRSVESLQ